MLNFIVCFNCIFINLTVRSHRPQLEAVLALCGCVQEMLDSTELRLNRRK